MKDGIDVQKVSVGDLVSGIASLSVGSIVVLIGLAASVVGGAYALGLRQTPTVVPKDPSTPLQKQLDETNQKVILLTSERDDALRRASELAKSLGEANTKRPESTRDSAQLDEANKRVSSLTQQLDQAKQQQNDAEGKLREANNRESELNKKVTDLQTQLREAQRGGGTGPIVKGRGDEGGPRGDTGSCLQMQAQWAGQRSALGAPEALKWNVNANQIRTRNDQRFLYSCPANGSIVAVYGGARGIYGTGSGICSAAVHRGLISASEGGTVAIKVDGGAEQLIRGGQDHGVSASYVNGGSSTFHFIDPVNGGELACK